MNQGNKQDEDSEPPNWDRFGETERITANLRFRSLTPFQRTYITTLALIPPKWRGPLFAFLFAILGILAGTQVPSLVAWVKEVWK